MPDLNTEVEEVETATPAVVDETKVEEAPKEGEEQQEEELGFITDEVNKRLGLEVEYPEDMTDHDSPEALYYRDGILMQRERDATLADIRDAYPDAYRLMLHLDAGNKLEDFDKVVSDPEWDTIKDNIDIQKQLFLRSRKEKGDDDDDAQTLLEKKIKNNVLGTEVEKYLNDNKSKNKERLDKLESDNKAQIAKDDEIHKAYAGFLTSVFNKKTFSNLTLADGEVSPAYTNFVNKLDYVRESEGFDYRIPVTKENVEMLIQLDHMYNNPDKFFKQKQAQAVQEKARTMQRQQAKVVEQQKTTNNTGVNVKYLP